MALLGYEIPENYLPYMLCDGTNIIKIYNQDIFEEYFGKGDEPSSGTTTYGWTLTKVGDLSVVTIPENTVVVFVPCAEGGTVDTYNGQRAYQLKTQVKLSSRVALVGFNRDKTIIAKCVDYGGVGEPETAAVRNLLKFTTTYKERQSTTVATNRFTCTSTNFNIGDIVIYEKNKTFYKVIDKDTGWIDVDRDIATSGAGALYVSSLVTDIVLDGWAFDGRGNVNGLGGDIYGTGENGGAFEIPYCGNSRFTLKTINHKAELDGGAFYGEGLSAFLNIQNVISCEAGTGSNDRRGGAVYGVSLSYFSFIRFCKVYGRGGGLSHCHRSEIQFIYGCQALDGSASGYGGGLNACQYSKIRMIEENYAQYRGGAGMECTNSEIEMIMKNKAGNNGAGFYNTSYSSFTNFFENTGGQAAYNCNNSAFYGSWQSNSGYITAANSIANVIYNGANAYITTPPGPDASISI